MIVQKQLNQHIQDKILYHEKLRKQFEATEQYEECAKHRNEITRLKLLMDDPG